MNLVFDNVNLDGLSDVAIKIKNSIETPAVIFLEGEVGAGKTTLIQSFNNGHALSPSYSLINEYEDSLHADFYRIENSADIEHLELSSYDDKRYFWAEWGEQFYSSIMDELGNKFSYKIDIFINPDDSRKITLSSF